MQYIYPKNFSRAELISSQTATRLDIDNEPKDNEIEVNLNHLAYWLQELRNRLSKHYKRDVPIRVTSGFRCEELNIRIGGSKRSAHCHALAADFTASGLTTKEVCLFIFQHCQDMIFDQCIDEFDRWVHIGIKKPYSNEARHQYLIAFKDSGKTRYKKPEYIAELDD